MDEAKTTPALDLFINAISNGSYDDELEEVSAAIGKRREVLKEELLERVRQVFGPDADVVVGQPEQKQNPFIVKSTANGNSIEVSDLDGEVKPDALSNLDTVEARMNVEGSESGREGGGAIISGLHSSDIAG